MYSRIFDRAAGGSCGAASMRFMIDAERPEDLWFPFRMVQAVLRGSPRAWACSSTVIKPEDRRACQSSIILAACRAFPSRPPPSNTRPSGTRFEESVSFDTVPDGSDCIKVLQIDCGSIVIRPE